MPAFEIMKCFLIAIIQILLIGFSNSYLTPPMVTEKYSEQELIAPNPNKSNDTLVFAQIVSVELLASAQFLGFISNSF